MRRIDERSLPHAPLSYKDGILPVLDIADKRLLKLRTWQNNSPVTTHPYLNGFMASVVSYSRPNLNHKFNRMVYNQSV